MPAEYERLVKKLKKNPDINNPYALAHHILNKQKNADYATTQRGKRKFPIGSPQDKLLHTRGLPHSHVHTNGKKRITRYDSGPSSKKSGSLFDLAMSTAKAILKIKEAQNKLHGIGAGKPDSAFDVEQLQQGIKVEMEHTKDPNTAKIIAKDHLTEDPDYYKKLKMLEKNARQASLNIRVANLKLMLGADFKEEEHPRDELGQFTCKTCGKQVAVKDKEKHEATHRSKTDTKRDEALGLLQKIRDVGFRDEDGNIDHNAVEDARKKAVALMEEADIEDALSKRGLEGDDLQNELDKIAELKDNEAQINSDGTVTVYHRTSPENKRKILRTGKFFGKEDGIFFSTKLNGQAEDFGPAVIKLRIPVEKLQIDDEFGDEVHLRIPTKKAGESVDLKQYISDIKSKSSSLGMSLYPQFRFASLESETGQYATYFLLVGDEINGRGWGVTEESIPLNIETFKGMPFVITTSEYIEGSPYGKIYDHPSTEHFDLLGIAPLGTFDVNNVELIKRFQNFFRIGEIIDVYYKDGVWRCIVKKDAKYSHVPWPPFCSPAIYKSDPHEIDGKISKWFGLHLAGLDQRPAYGKIAILKAVCNGSYGTCEHQLKSASLGFRKSPCYLKKHLDNIKKATQELAAMDSDTLSDTQIVNLLQMTTNKKKKKYLKSKKDPLEFSRRLRNTI